MIIDYEKLREFRIKLGVQQTDVASKVGMPKQLLCAYEKGHQRPTLKYFPQICAFYEKPMEYFLKEVKP